MTDKTSFKSTFDSLAVDGCIGDPTGALAYCYVRVSSSEQADELASGIPRQIQHIHDVACERGYKVSWDLVFADDHTGFEFKDRPELSRLRQEYKTSRRRAHTVIIESLDRLSRNADWHQGFLLDEMREYDIQVVFWKSFSSRIERAVMGAISQDGMEEAKRRMIDGNILKAKSGRITARQRAYGYIFVDSEGQESPKAKKDTYYAPYPQEAAVVRLIYERIAAGQTTRSLSTELEALYPPPKNYKYWYPKQITLLIQKPLYKGEYIARRHKEVTIHVPAARPTEPARLVKRKVERPREEWISVAVPPLVSPELWSEANRMLKQNVKMARRNAKEPYLLTGLIRCATCGLSYIGERRMIKRGRKTYLVSSYRCNARRGLPLHVMKDIGCTQGQISCARLDSLVWYQICQVLLEPTLLLAYLDSLLTDEKNVALASQIKYQERLLEEKRKEDEKLYRAYMADVFDEIEYLARRRELKDTFGKLEQELAHLQDQEVTRGEIENKRKFVLLISERARAQGMQIDMPFAVKQRVIKTVVDQIILNQREGWFRIEGIIPGTFSLTDDIVSTSVDTDWRPRSR